MQSGTALKLVLLVATLSVASGSFTVPSTTTTKQVTISNSEPRLDTKGEVVDAGEGNIVFYNNTYFLYGEAYGMGSWHIKDTARPKLVVYTSPDMSNGSWEFRGFLHNNTSPGWAASGQWPHAPKGTWWSPEAIYNPKTGKIVLWFSATAAECCDAFFGVAQSDDGVHFELVTLTETPASKASVDCSSLLIDDDGSAYVLYTAMNAPGQPDHVLGIDRLSPDMLSTTKEQVGQYLPDSFMEGGMLFKRKGVYYVVAGSCCCACRQGAGAVVYASRNIAGPWLRQSRDVNCRADAPICAGMPAEAGLDRPTGELTINAQGIGISLIPTAEGTAYLWSGARWLSAPNNPSGCDSLCSPDCVQPPGYNKGHDFQYWIPLEFDEGDGSRVPLVKPFAAFVDEFTLDLVLKE